MGGSLQAATPQTISFPAIKDRLSTDGAFALTATASSGLAVSYSIVSSPERASVSGGMVTLTGAPGAVTVRASQAGNGTYEAAAPVLSTFTVVDAARRFVKLASGPLARHSAGIRADGTLWTWGNNSHGQLGDGTTLARETPQQVGTDTNWTTVACGQTHTLAIRSDGTLWAWGSNQYYQLGQGAGADIPPTSSVPVQIGTETNWASVAGGYTSTLAIRTDGTLWGWGANISGILGDGSVYFRQAPVQIGTDTNWASISMGYLHAAGTRTDGTLWTWGIGFYGQLGDGGPTGRYVPGQVGTDSSWTQVVCGADHTLALRGDGTLWACGMSGSGQTGVVLQPGGEEPTDGVYALTQVSTDTHWASLSAGWSHSLGVRTDGTLWLWGTLGSGQVTFLMRPTQIAPTQAWTAAAAGENHAMVLRADGTLWAWGSNTFGQVGNGTAGATATPQQAGSATTWTQVARGSYHSAALRADGTLWTWGKNTNGQLGDGSKTDHSQPQRVGTATNWSAIACGEQHTLGLRSDGTLWAWGLNDFGQLGTSNYTTSATPVRVGTGSTWTAIACGRDFSAGLRRDGTLCTWGNNYAGKLGNGTGSRTNVALQVGTATTWASMACGQEHMLATRTDGTLWSWGYNYQGQLGDGTTTDRSAPVQVGTDTNWASVAAGFSHTLALRTDGTLWSWGGNSGGVLGNGSTTNQLTPAQAGSDTTWLRVSCGSYHSAGMRADGSLWTWGNNPFGQLGLGGGGDRSTPEKFAGGGSWSALAAGGNHTLAVRADGTLWEVGVLSAAPEHVTPTRSWPLRSAQTVDFPAQVSLTHGQPRVLGAAASSGLPVGYEVAGPATLSVVDGRTLLPTAPGSVTLTARQDGDEAWIPATSATQVVPVQAGPVASLSGNGQTIPRADLQPTLADDTDFGDVATQGDSRTRSFTITNTGSAELTLTGPLLWGENAADFSFATLPAASVPPGGSTTFQITFDPSVPGLRQSGFTVTSNEGEGFVISLFFAIQGNGVSQAVILPPVADHLTTDAPFALGSTATSGLPISYTVLSSPPGIASITGGVVTLSGTAGSVTVIARQAGNGEYEPATEVLRTFMVTAPQQAFVKIGSGPQSDHGGGIRADGTLWTWGLNSSNQLGHTGSALAQVGTATNWTDVAFGYTHTVGLRADGTLWSWGNSLYGQLGHGNSSPQSLPKQIGTGTTWTAVACGSYHTLALLSDGSVWAWGSSSRGELGIGTASASSPMRVTAGTVWTAIAGGYRHSLAVRSDRTLWSWGDNSNGELGDGTTTSRNLPGQVGTATNWARISSGLYHNAGLRTDGTLWTWGRNEFGQLGYDTTAGEAALTPRQVGTGTNWTHVVCGYAHTVARRNDGTLWAWGYNADGRLGDSTTLQRNTPVQVGGNSSGWSTSFSDTAALRPDGSLWAWGPREGSPAALGSDTAPSPTAVGTTMEWASISTGTTCNAAIRRDGTLWTWGSNTGQGTESALFLPTQLGTATGWAAVACGQAHTAALRVDGSLWLWGANTYGQLGDGSHTTRLVPTQTGVGSRWVAVACGDGHTLALRSDGTLWACGLNDLGQLGVVNQAGSMTLLQVGTATNWSAIRCGGNFTVAQRTDGSLWSWGANTRGQLGINLANSGYSFPNPSQVGTATDWTAFSCGALHVLATRADGTLWAWGDNASGQQGMPGSTSRARPTQVGTAADWASVAAGATHSLATRRDRTLWAAGANSGSQLGDGSTTASSVFKQISSAPVWEAVSGAQTRSTALRADGSLWTWGSSFSSSLGQWNSAAPARMSPVRAAQAVAPFTLPELSLGVPVTVTASATSGLPVAFTVIGPASLVGNVLTPTGPGLVQVTAWQFGDAAWQPSAPMTQGQMVYAPKIELSAASSTGFGSASVAGGQVIRTFTLANIGTADLTLGRVVVTGTNAADFTLIGVPASAVGPGDSTSFQITFAPSDIGLRTATVTLSTNDPDENPFTFTLQGTGTLPAADWRQTHFGTTANDGTAADTHDADHDGLANLIEYAFGLSPVAGGSVQLPVPQRAGNAFTVTFTEPAGVTGVTYGASYSTTLAAGSWTPIPDTGSGSTHVFSVPVSGADTKVFIQLSVTAAP